LLSYSKKPPERAGTLPEVFELALELVQFHGHGSFVTLQVGAKRGRNSSPLLDQCGREYVVHEQLQAVLTLIFVHIQAVHEASAA
jgi:hypothetical protein